MFLGKSYTSEKGSKDVWSSNWFNQDALISCRFDEGECSAQEIAFWEPHRDGVNNERSPLDEGARQLYVAQPASIRQALSSRFCPDSWVSGDDRTRESLLWGLESGESQRDQHPDFPCAADEQLRLLPGHFHDLQAADPAGAASRPWLLLRLRVLNRSVGDA